jgi:TonB dependent receptor/Carboxypeptidase regulatory-like domain/TonB-dependent Receptor Plug Domain
MVYGFSNIWYFIYIASIYRDEKFPQSVTMGFTEVFAMFLFRYLNNISLGSIAKKCLMTLFIAIAANVYADTGKVRLVVTDADTQRPITGVSIKITSRSGIEQTVTVNDQGIAKIDSLQTGLFSVVISHPSYQRQRLPTVRVEKNKTTPLEARLSVLSAGIVEIMVLGKAMGGNPLNPVGSSNIDREELNSAAGSGGDVLRSLDGLPGLFGDGEFSSFTVRGNGPRDNLILVDGVPFENLVHFSDSFGDPDEVEGGGRYSVFAPNTIGKAEFQPGGWNPAYGGKSGSLLKLDVAEGNPETASYRTRVDIAGFEIGYDGPSGFHDQTSILFSARDYNFDRLFQAIGLDDIGTPKLTDVILKSSSELGDSDRLKILAIYAPEEYQRDIDNVLASDESGRGDFGGTDLVSNKTDNSLLSATWTRLIGSDSQLSNQVYFRNYEEDNIIGEAYPDLVPLGTESEDIPQRENILNSNREETELGLQTDFETGNSLGRFSGGLRVIQTDLSFALALTDDWIRYTYDQNDYREIPEQQYLLLTPEAINNRYQQKEINYVAYLNQDFLLDAWSFRAGARYERDNFSEENLLSPRLGATWPVNDNLRVTTTAGRYFQAPRSNDRASDATATKLENEIVDQYSIGFAYQINSDVQFFIEPYYQELDNLIVQEDSVNKTLSNQGTGSSFGVDTALTRQFDNGWSASINYSYNDARLRDNPDNREYNADFNRPHIFTVGGVWEINQRWKISSRWKWATGKPRDKYLINENVLGAGQPLRYSRETIETNADRFDSFSSLNVRLDYIRTFGRTKVIAFVDVINLLESDNPSNSDFNERRGVDETEDGSALPIIGLMFEW